MGRRRSSSALRSASIRSTPWRSRSYVTVAARLLSAVSSAAMAARQELDDSGSEFLGEIELFFDPRTQLTEFGLGDLLLLRRLGEGRRAHRDKQDRERKDSGYWTSFRLVYCVFGSADEIQSPRLGGGGDLNAVSDRAYSLSLSLSQYLVPAMSALSMRPFSVSW